MKPVKAPYVSVCLTIEQSDNPCHNILELYKFLVKIRFATRKTKLDILYSKLGIQVPSQVVECLNT